MNDPLQLDCFLLRWGNIVNGGIPKRSTHGQCLVRRGPDSLHTTDSYPWWFLVRDLIASRPFFICTYAEMAQKHQLLTNTLHSSLNQSLNTYIPDIACPAVSINIIGTCPTSFNLTIKHKWTLGQKSSTLCIHIKTIDRKSVV